MQDREILGKTGAKFFGFPGAACHTDQTLDPWTRAAAKYGTM